MRCARGRPGRSPAAPLRSRSRPAVPRAPARTCAGSSVRSSSSGCPRSTRSPGLARQITPAPALTGSSFRARPAPSRHAAVPTASASRSPQPARAVGRHDLDVPRDRQRPRQDRRPARRSSRGTSPAPGRRPAPAPGRPRSRPAPASPGQRQRDRRPGRSGPAPRSISIDSATSTALPTARPSGTSIAVSSAVVRTPDSVPSRTMVCASSRAASRSRMNAPRPTLTSSTSACVPSAIFLDMIELAISGIDSTVPVTSRRA